MNRNHQGSLDMAHIEVKPLNLRMILTVGIITQTGHLRLCFEYLSDIVLFLLM